MMNLWKLGLSIIVILVVVGCAQKTAEPVASVPQKQLYEVVVKQVVMGSMGRRSATPVIILANKENDRQFLPIGVGMSEGISISMALKKSISKRPGTHDLFASVLGQFHMKLVKVVITDLREDTYIAMIMMESHGEAKEIDARPSDGIALALRCVAPVFVSEEVIRKGGWMEAPEQDERKSGAKKEDIML